MRSSAQRGREKCRWCSLCPSEKERSTKKTFRSLFTLHFCRVIFSGHVFYVSRVDTPQLCTPRLCASSRGLCVASKAWLLPWGVALFACCYLYFFTHARRRFLGALCLVRRHDRSLQTVCSWCSTLTLYRVGVVAVLRNDYTADGVCFPSFTLSFSQKNCMLWPRGTI